MRVGVTRPEADAAPLVRRLQQAGCEAILLPVMRREVVRDALSDVAPDEQPVDVLLLTSPAAAEACGPLAGRVGVVGCVGPGTATAARRILGDGPMVVPETHDGASLVRALGDLRGRRVLWVRGAQVTAATARALSEAGAQVTAVIAYRTILDPDAARRRLHRTAPPDVVTLTSPRIAQAWADTGSTELPVVCIGPTTAEAARRRGLDVVAVATPHDLDGLVDAVVAWGARR